MNIENTPLDAQTKIFNKQKEFFETGATLDYSFRKNQLKTLKKVIKNNEEQIFEALDADFGKPKFETFVSEIGFLYDEINHALSNLKSWMRPKLVDSPFLHFPSTSKILYQPKGVCLVIGPWNYPVNLIISPLIASMAAGNTNIIKPPEQTPYTAALIEKMLTENFEENYIGVVQGDGKYVVPELMQNHIFDHVFFTGSVAVGKKIAEMAAPNLIPLTLELGGKSPVVVDETANLKIAARRIAFGKFLNAGQTCVAPDYLIVHEKIKEDFIKQLKEAIQGFYQDPFKSSDYAQIVNRSHYERLRSLLSEGQIMFGGEADDESLKIAPTLIENVQPQDKLYSEEIFGPILPIFSYSSDDEAFSLIKKNPNPLSFYIFSQNRKKQKKFTERLSFGGGAINNTVIHLSNPDLPFGGVGTSGFGNYHGKAGFKTFSHEKSIMKTGTWFDLKQKYPPYSNFIMKVVRFFMK